MPFLRVIRDKRGYETTYLTHWFREGQRQRTRILYVFRSPGGVRVGRQVLEPEMIRQLESAHPDIAFDWAAVREHKQVIETSPEPRRRPRRGSAGGDGDVPARAPKPAAPPEAVPPPVSRPSIPAAMEGATPDEQIAFLATWYPQIKERIVQRAADPSRREALLALAERVNPTTWTDADQITTGLQQAAEALERLAHVFARRRRRARKRPGETSAGEPPVAEGTEPAAVPAAPTTAIEPEAEPPAES